MPIATYSGSHSGKLIKKRRICMLFTSHVSGSNVNLANWPYGAAPLRVEYFPRESQIHHLYNRQERGVLIRYVPVAWSGV